jgi:hypothetical protein
MFQHKHLFVKKVKSIKESAVTCHYFTLVLSIYRMSQNSRIPNSERGREGPSGALKYLEKKSLFLKKI